MLTETQKHWNNATLEYDLDRYNWPAWALSVIQEVAPKVKALETLHLELTPSELVTVSAHVQNSCSRMDFMTRFEKFVEEYAVPRIAGRRYLIQRQGTLRVVIPNQAKVGRRLWFHQGIFVGNGRGCRTIWTPFTRAENSNTMWILDLDISRDITRRVVQERWDLERFEQECMKHAWPVNLSPGQSHLFFQEHLHGNINNDGDYTRVSMDMRILIEGEEYLRRNPGGFMRLPGDYEAADHTDYSNRMFVTYAGWNSQFSQGQTLPMQRAIINDYCVRHGISINDSVMENEFMDWQPALEHYIRQRPDGIVLCSIYSLTDDVERRQEILETAVDLGVELHFANELMTLRDRQDLDRIQTYLSFAVPKQEPFVWER